MPSSISGSDVGSAKRAITILLVMMLVYGCALEAVTRLAFSRINHIWRAVQADRGEAVALRPVTTRDAETVLMVGNSYLDIGVNRQALQREISPAYAVGYLPISGTSYLDWQFGLRRLFAEGAHPAIVGVCLSTRDLISDATLGEEFARTLMRRRDLWQVKEASRLDSTEVSNYFFASLSEWLGHRGEIHNWLLRKSLPSAADLAQQFRPKNQALPSADVIVAQALPRLRLLNQLCNENRIRFFLLIPPSRDVRDASDELRAAAAREGLLVLLPFEHAELPESAFLDGAHLNPDGAAIFTQRLGPVLVRSLVRN